MSNWFEVKITSVKVVVVEVEPGQAADEAEEFAVDGIDFVEVESTPIPEADLPTYKRHADEVMSLSGASHD